MRAVGAKNLVPGAAIDGYEGVTSAPDHHAAGYTAGALSNECNGPVTTGSMGVMQIPYEVMHGLWPPGMRPAR